MHKMACVVLVALWFGFIGTAFAQKVDVCHRPPDNPTNINILSIGSGGLASHLAHGDNLFGVEVCDNVDNDCDGVVDNEPVCTPPVACPCWTDDELDDVLAVFFTNDFNSCRLWNGPTNSGSRVNSFTNVPVLSIATAQVFNNTCFYLNRDDNTGLFVTVTDNSITSEEADVCDARIRDFIADNSLSCLISP